MLTTKQQEARNKLLTSYINKKTKLIISIKSVSKTGMSRRMRVCINDQHISDISYLIADLCDLSINDKGLLIKGCGMNMTFWLADDITHYLYPNKKPAWLSGNGGSCLDWTAV